jgi:hypothetical protein
MFTIRINWNQDVQFPTYSAYAAKHYTVNDLADGNKHMYIANGDSEPAEVLLSRGCKVYVMNDKGSTVDTITV